MAGDGKEAARINPCDKVTRVEIPDSDDVSPEIIAQLVDAGEAQNLYGCFLGLSIADAKMTELQRRQFAMHIVAVDIKERRVISLRRDYLISGPVRAQYTSGRVENCPVNEKGHLVVCPPGHRL